MTRIRLATLFLIATFCSPASHAQFPPAPGTGPGLPETIEAIDAARVTTRILYVTAHPDDESGAILTYLARGLHADVALLSITRGEGGQNALGPEQAPQLGLIRTQELLAATRGYGVKLYFTRAKDFGFSKTPEETEKIWGDPVMEDMVRVIREFRPNIVINGWGGVHGGHGHHQLSGIWTPKAVKLAADPKYLPDPQIPAWDAIGSGVKILDVDRGSDSPKGYLLPVDDISSLYGKSWREIGLDAFSNHRSQGISAFLSSPFLRRPLALLPEDGSKLDPASLAVTLQAMASLKGPCGCEEQLKEVDRSLESARASAIKLDWPAAVNSLVAAEQSLKRASLLSIPSPIPPDLYNKLDFLGRENENLGRALQLAAGVQISADADRADVAAGEDFTVALHCRCRPEIHCQFSEPQFLSLRTILRQKMDSGKDTDSSWTLALGDPKSGDLAAPLPPILYPPPDARLSPEPAPVLRVAQKIQIGGFSFSPARIVLCTSATSTTVSRVPLRIAPAVTLAIEPSQVIAVLGQNRKPFDVLLRIHSYSTKPSTVSVALDVPDGIQASAPVEVHFDGVGDQYAKLTVTPPAKLAPGNFTITAYAKRGHEKFSTSLEPLPTMPSILWSEPAQTVVHAFDINVPANLHVGYISAEGEKIPEALKRLGISVEMLDANALTFGDLSKYSAIVVGVRAYELRPELASANKRLLDYVSNGGTVVVQYNRDFIWNKFLPAPYHATIGNPTPRITDETAEVKFLKPDDPLLNTPNKITAADFQNWVQERGLYYWSDFDEKYTPLLSMHDPGEKDLNGSLVYTPSGKGVYIYTGLAFFRELPEGVPGAYRLFVNLLSAAQLAH
ncbi:MAG TPA: PIG-L family deacetylase [Candidatus Limnocylindrales bacterium]|nr:PIG-L family deacetylase [Candidatus Limnocylindrales bacterium]